jgi:hypothetical protein
MLRFLRVGGARPVFARDGSSEVFRPFTFRGLPKGALSANWTPFNGGIRIESILVIVAACLVLAVLGLWLRDRGERGRQNAIRALLDGADALESRLQECRERMQHLRDMLVVLPEEMSAQADSALQADAKVQAALKDLLAHRLWIQQRAATASLQELTRARQALDQSGTTLQAQLDRLAAIAADLQRAQTESRTLKKPESQ